VQRELIAALTKERAAELIKGHDAGQRPTFSLSAATDVNASSS